MTQFCDNPLCFMHEIPATPDKTEVLKDGCLLVHWRHFVNGFAFCDICYNVILMTQGENNANNDG